MTYIQYPVIAPKSTCLCDVAYCHQEAVHDFGSYCHIVGFTGEIRFLCTEHLKKTSVGKEKSHPRGHCQKCGQKRVEGRYCPACDHSAVAHAMSKVDARARINLRIFLADHCK